MERQEYLNHVLDLYVADETRPGYPIARALVETAEECSEFVLSMIEGKDSVIEQKHELGDILYFVTYLKHVVIQVLGVEFERVVFEWELGRNHIIDPSGDLVIDFTRASMLFSKALKRLERDMKYKWDEEYLFNLAVLVDDLQWLCEDYCESEWGMAVGNIYSLNIEKLLSRKQADGSQITARDRNAEDAL